MWLTFLCIWLGLGIVAQLIGMCYEGKWNGLWNCLIVIGLGLFGLLAVISDIQDEEFEKRE